MPFQRRLPCLPLKADMLKRILDVRLWLCLASAELAILGQALSCGGSVTNLDGGVDAPADGTSIEASNDAGAAIRERWSRYCVIMTACGFGDYYLVSFDSDGGEPVNLMTQCIAAQFFAATTPEGTQVPGGFLWQDCVLDGGASCTNALTCANGGNPDLACDAKSPEWEYFQCRDNSEVQCGGFGKVAVDCSKLGGFCVPMAGCVIGKCEQPTEFAGNSCYKNTYGQCETLERIDGGPDSGWIGYFVPGTPCQDLGGSTCSDAAYGCIGPGPVCTGGRCDGSTLVSCVGGHEARFDCAEYGLTCISDPNPDTNFDNTKGAFCGLGTECGYNYADSCHGTELHYCNAGKLATLDCAAEGFSKCVVDSMGTHCAP
jgi:hypothetical protein